MGGTILSGSILDGQDGAKLCYSPCVDNKACVFASAAFQAAEPGLTLIVREACTCEDGSWTGKTLQEVKEAKGRQNKLVLQGPGETFPGSKPKQVCFYTGDELVAWATKTTFLSTKSAWIKGSS